MNAPAAALAGKAAPRAWPALREELRLHSGPVDAQGQPSWTLHDPVRHRFVRIDWVSHEILRRWWLADPALIAEQVRAETTLQVDAGDVLAVLELALREELAHPVQPPAGRQDARGSVVDALRWLLHHYLFFRIPLWRPDAWLARLLPILRGFGGPVFTRISLLALVLGLIGLQQQTERLSAQWLDLLSWQGLALYGSTLAAVKLAHEMGHALAAKAAGLRVPTMGIAFMVMWPVAYTDTTEAWRLADARARRRIAAAGVRTELTLAAWATLAWTLLPAGPWSTAAFIVGTITWVSSLLINLSPFMRFDGYFLLCDALDLPNLHERSFALARWWLRRVLLGWDTLQPEPTMSPARRRALVAFALTTWAYRFVLYLGIAWMVYQFGFKALGLTLFVVELGWFIVAPVAREAIAWQRGWPHWRKRPRARQSAALAVALVALGFVPFAATRSGAALLLPAHHLAVRLPAAVTIESAPPMVGQAVRSGEVLLRASPAQTVQQLQAAQARVQQLEREVAAAALGGDPQAQWGSLQASLATARGQAEASRQELARFTPTAPFDGVVVEVHRGWRAGDVSPPPREALVHLASPGQWRVVAYADEPTAAALSPGAQARFVADAAPWRAPAAQVISVAQQPSLFIAEPALVRPHGGAIEAKETGAGWVPGEALYRVELAVDADGLAFAPRVWRGHVVFAGPAISVWQRVWRLAEAAWLREAGF